MAAGIFYFLNGIVLVGVLTSFIFWVRRLLNQAVGRSRPLVPLTDSGREPPWSVLDFLVMFGLMIVSFLVLTVVFTQQGWIVASAKVITDTSEAAPAAAADPNNSIVGVLIANSLANIIAMSVTLVWIVICNRIPFSRMGLTPQAADAKLGLKATWWFLPPVLIISLVVSLVVPYEHPVLESLAHVTSPSFFLLMFFGTAVVAPICEEFMFRVLLQGGLQRIADRPHAAASEATNVAITRTWTPRAFWPIVVTSAVFAVMHMGQGAAPIPLFFLSIALGYLYRQTGRITAPLVVHAALNSLTLAVEFSRLAAGIPTTTGF